MTVRNHTRVGLSRKKSFIGEESVGARPQAPCLSRRHLPGMAPRPEPWHCPAGAPGVSHAAGGEVPGDGRAWAGAALTPVLLDERPSDAMEAQAHIQLHAV